MCIRDRYQRRVRGKVAKTMAFEEEVLRHAADRITFNPCELTPTETWLEIGDGGYSTVFSADWLGTSVAIKRTADKKQTARLALLRELRLLRLAGPHPNLVKVMGVFEEEHRLHCVLEYVPHTLRSTELILVVDLVSVLSDVARALVHIHQLGIVHRDIKARNVLVTSADRMARAKLIDFGLACSLEQDSSEWLHRSVGTKSYRPPEMKQRSRAAGSQDIFSNGAMTLKLAKKLPKTTEQQIGDYKLLSRIGAHCLEKDPENRPTAMAVLSALQAHINRPLGAPIESNRTSISWAQECALEIEEQAMEDQRYRTEKSSAREQQSSTQALAADAEDAAMGKRSRPDSHDEDRQSRDRYRQ
eukprot:TRINITY_DN20180_c0_g1_i2.p1 TRINITY_DN20180_c0_g1~~TRINITY_DN20180_c0_g1_i2.p1  ORF type:complete len:359 (+),score=85.27 TRINITY_DN20180_c0_g1_i2:151-1227(+)